VDEIRAKGYNLKQLEDLEPDVELDAELLSSLNAALGELYEMSVDESLLIRY